jgi:hypothetical protein
MCYCVICTSRCLGVHTISGGVLNCPKLGGSLIVLEVLSYVLQILGVLLGWSDLYAGCGATVDIHATRSLNAACARLVWKIIDYICFADRLVGLYHRFRYG